MNRHQRRMAKSKGTAQAMFGEAVRRHQAGRAADAEAMLREALKLDPGHADSLHCLGVIAHQSGHHQEAAELIGQAIAIRDDVPFYHSHLGMVLLALGKSEEALAHCERAAALMPDNAECQNNLGNLRAALGRLDEAVDCYRRAIAIDPKTHDLHLNLGLTLRLQGRIDEAFDALGHHAELTCGADGPCCGPVPPHKAKHDREQFEYLVATGARTADLRRVREAVAREPGCFAKEFERLHHIEGCACLAGPAVNPDLDAAAIGRRWDESRPKMVVIDDLLTPQALDEFRRFCLGSTVWRLPYDDGYLGAFANTGFACPLLAQIAAELAAKIPGIIREHRLIQWWGFKYDSLHRGIRVHADLAAVNVNFWITPDEANLDAESGGLVVWDVPAPLDWDFKKYNADESAIRAFLAENGASSVTVPYRCNRAVIFDSDLFHETDRIAFKEGYLNRRINVTLLYGLRQHDTSV
jgi:Flp pilus assembly protein TadD